MAQPSSHRIVVAATAALALGAAVTAPAVAGAAMHKHVAAAKGAAIRIEKSAKYGDVLSEGDGQTLYFLAGKGARPLPFTGACSAVWPPALSSGKPLAEKGIDRKLLGTVRRGGHLQVTYAGRPLYRYAGDIGAGEVNGEDIHSFGGTWYLLDAKGAPVQDALTSAGSSGSGSKGSSGGW